MNNVLVALKFRNKLMFQFFVHFKSVGCSIISSKRLFNVTDNIRIGNTSPKISIRHLNYTCTWKLISFQKWTKQPSF